jgi:hypothetical protein
MNSYTFGINGSWWLVALFVLLSFAFTYYVYRKTVPPISKSRKGILVFLRTMALSLLIFVLFEPVIGMISSSEIMPKLLVMMDNSESMELQDAGGDRKEQYQNAINASGFAEMDQKELLVSTFDSEAKKYEFYDEKILDISGKTTNMSDAFKWALKNSSNDNIKATLLFTDGAFNEGNNPIYSAEMFAKPVYVIGIGDSSQIKDVSIQYLMANEVAYLDNPVPVNVLVRIDGYEEGELKAELFDNGELIGEQTFSITPEIKEINAIFEYLPKSEGVHKLTAKINEFEGEITAKNNKAHEFVRVIKNKRNIVIFGGAPSSDISFIKQELKDEKGVSITSFIQKKGAEFYGPQPTKRDLMESELIILCGFPIYYTSDATLKLIAEELEAGKPVMFIASKDIDYQKLKRLENYLPVNTVSHQPREFLAVTEVRPEAITNAVVRFSGADSDIDMWNALPPIFKTETFVNVKPESEIVAYMQVNNVSINEPMIVTRDFQNKKSLSVLGYGLYRWKLMGYAADQAKGREDKPDLYSIFLRNAVRWLSVENKSKFVSIKADKKFYSQGDEVQIIAQVYDASYTPVDNANVRLVLSGGADNSSRDVVLNSVGNGKYSSMIEGLGTGDYYFKGSAQVNGSGLGKDEGRFSVGDVSIEYSNLRMNVQLLREIAERTGGKFYTAEQADEFMDDLKQSGVFEANFVAQRSEIPLWNLPWALALAILLFSIEWFLRKRAGLL